MPSSKMGTPGVALNSALHQNRLQEASYMPAHCIASLYFWLLNGSLYPLSLPAFLSMPTASAFSIPLKTGWLRMRFNASSTLT